MLSSLFKRAPQAPPPHTPRNEIPANPYPENIQRINPANVPRTKVAQKYTSFEEEEIINNPLSIIKDFIQTEQFDGIKLLNFDNILQYADIKKRYFDEKLEKNLSYAKDKLSKNFKNVLFNFLKNSKIVSIDVSSLCGEYLRFIAGFKYNYDYDTKKVVGLYYRTEDQTIKDVDLMVTEITKYEPMFTFEDLYLCPTLYNKNNYLNEDLYKQTITDIKKYFEVLVNNNDIFDKINKELSECKNPYYIVPMGYYQQVSNYEEDDTDILNPIKKQNPKGHANLLFLDKFNQRAVIIEPGFYGTINTPDPQQVVFKEKTVKHFLERLNTTEYKFTLPLTPYPQTIAQDKNCAFWTFLITVTYLLNPGVLSVDQIAKTIIKKYPNPNDLIVYINKFKVKLFLYIESIEKVSGTKFGGKRRRTIRRKPKNRKRTRKAI